MGAYTFLNKRTGKDIWKNLFELPLIETEQVMEEKELISNSEFQQLFAKDEKPSIRCLCKNVKHVLSHRIIYANFYEVILPENSSSLSSFQKVEIADIERYAVPRLIHSFFEKYL